MKMLFRIVLLCRYAHSDVTMLEQEVHLHRDLSDQKHNYN